MPDGEWRRKGDCESETLWLSFFNIFNAFLAAEPFQDDADLVLGGMVLARGSANIAGQLFSWHPRGWGREFLAHLHSPWGYDEPEILRYSNRQLGPIGADAGQRLPNLPGGTRASSALR